jgi:hypothetical protein
MLLESYGFGIRLKPQMDKGNFILRPTFSLGLLARVTEAVVRKSRVGFHPKRTYGLGAKRLILSSR